MIRLRTTILLILLVTVLASGIAYGAASWYWRGGKYTIPRYNANAAIADILTEHRTRLDTLTAQVTVNTTAIATNAANIATNTTNIGTNTTNIASNSSAISAHVGNTGNAHSHDARYARDAGENLRVIRGFVRANGTITLGTGFTVTKGATGVYTINYATPFGGIAVPVVTSVQHGLVNGGSWGNFSATFTIQDVDKNDQNDDFMFVVLGPQ